MNRAVLSFFIVLVIPCLAHANPDEFYLRELVKQCDASNPMQRALALSCFKNFRKLSQAAERRILKAVEDENPKVRKAAWSVILKSEFSDPKYWTCLIKHKDTKSPELRLSIVDKLSDRLYSMESYDFKILEAVAQSINDKDKRVKLRALKGMGNSSHSHSSKTFSQALKKALANDDIMVRKAALDAAQTLVPVQEELLPLILKSIQSTQYLRIEFLGRFRNQSSQVLPFLKKEIQKGNSYNALQALALLNNKEALDFLVSQVGQENATQLAREGAAAMLPSFKPELFDKSHFESLCKALQSAYAKQERQLPENIGEALAHAGKNLSELPPSFYELFKTTKPESVNMLLRVTEKLGAKAAGALKFFGPYLRSKTHVYQALAAVTKMKESAAPIVPELIELLKSKDYRPNVLQMLWNLGPAAAPAIPSLLKILETDKSHSNKLRAMRVLGSLGKEAKIVIPAMIKTLQSIEIWESSLFYGFADSGFKELLSAYQSSKIPRVKFLILYAFTKTHTDLKLYLPALKDAFLSDKPPLRRAALKILAQLGPRAVPAMEFLLELHRSNDRHIKGAISLALAKMGHRFEDDANNPLAQLKSDDREIRQAGAVSLGNEASKPKLVQALTLAVFQSRGDFEKAVFALHKLGQKRLVRQFVIWQMRADQDHFVRNSGLDTVQRLGKDAQFAKALLLAGLNDSERDSSWKAAMPKALNAIHSNAQASELNKVIEEGFNHTESAFQVAAIDAALLAPRFPKAKLEAPFTKLSQSKDIWVRLKAIHGQLKLNTRKVSEERVLEVLGQAIRSDNEVLKAEALHTISQFPPLQRVFLKDLARWASGSNRFLIKGSLALIEKMGPEAQAAKPFLEKAFLASQSPLTRHKYLVVLNKLGGSSDQLVDALLEQYKASSYYYIKGEVARALGRAKTSKKALDALKSMTRSPLSNVRARAILSLGKIDAPVELLKDNLLAQIKLSAASEETEMARQALGLRIKDAVKVVEELLQSPNQSVRQNGVLLVLEHSSVLSKSLPIALKEWSKTPTILCTEFIKASEHLGLNGGEALPLITKHFFEDLRPHRDSAQVAALKIALAKLKKLESHKNANASERLKLIAAHLPGIEFTHRELLRLEKYLGSGYSLKGPPFAKTVLEGAIEAQLAFVLSQGDAKSPEIRLLSIQAIAKVGRDSAPVLKTLKKALKDPKKQVQAAAAKALEQFQKGK